MIQTAIDSLCGMINNIPQTNEASRHKAKILQDFATKVSEEILRRAGFDEKDSEQWRSNLLAIVAGIPYTDVPQDTIGRCGLFLRNLPSSLTGEDGNISLAHALVFGNNRVIELNDKTGKPRRVMSYEETARFLVFWLQIKILEISRKNNWDRISGLPDLYDRIEAMTASLTQKPISGEELQRKLGLPYNPADLLADLHILGLPMKTYHTLLNSYATRNSGFGFRIKSLRLDYLVTLKRAEFQKVKNLGRKSINGFVEILRRMGLDIGMTIPDEVKAWCEALAKEEPTE